MNSYYIEIAKDQIAIQKKINEMIDATTTDESLRELLAENITTVIREYHFTTELERH